MWKNWDTSNLRHLFRDELDSVCFAHDAAYSNSKHLAKKTILEYISKDSGKNIARDPTYDGCQRGLASVLCIRKREREQE